MDRGVNDKGEHIFWCPFEVKYGNVFGGVVNGKFFVIVKFSSDNKSYYCDILKL